VNAIPPPPKVGVWRAILGLGDAKVKHFLWPEGLPALLIGGGGAVLVVRATSVSTRASATSALVVLAGALLAVSFAALAIVVSLPSSRYLRALSEVRGGIKAFLDPFLVAIGTQLAIILLALGYELFASHVPWEVEHGAFYVLGFVFVFGLLDVAALARSLVRHGILRSMAAAMEDVEDEQGSGDVHPLRRTNPPA
jgi:hypothetical protein